MKNIKKYWVVSMLVVIGIAMSCQPDESLYPLPYDDRGTGSYLRVYQIVSNVWDLDDLANSGFEAIYESVDKNGGADLTSAEFYATHRSGATGLITNEVMVKTIVVSSFVAVSVPTYSEYIRSSPIRITVNESIAALSTLTTDPVVLLGSCSVIFPDVSTMVPF